MSKITLEGHLDITSELPIPEGKIVNKPLYVSDENKYIDANAFIREKRKEFCEDCEHRKGMKNGKMQFVYEIGGVRCRVCEIGDMIDAVDDFIAADVAPVVHGHWVNIENAKNTIKCSNCEHIRELKHFSEIIKRPKLCEMCGAVMDESEDKDDESKCNKKAIMVRTHDFCSRAEWRLPDYDDHDVSGLLDD